MTGYSNQEASMSGALNAIGDLCQLGVVTFSAYTLHNLATRQHCWTQQSLLDSNSAVWYLMTEPPHHHQASEPSFFVGLHTALLLTDT